MPKKKPPKIPEAVKQWLTEQGKKGGRPITNTSKEAEANRQRQKAYRERKKEKE